MKPGSAKAKGRRLQQWTRDYMLNLTNGVLKDDDIRSTSMGAPGEDILLSTRARDIFPLSIECKNKERINIWDSYGQAMYHANRVGYEACVVFCRNRAKPLVAIDAEFFLTMVEEWSTLKMSISNKG